VDRRRAGAGAAAATAEAAGQPSPPAERSAIVRGMERGKAADVVTILAELREQVRALDERVAELGRHL